MILVRKENIRYFLSQHPEITGEQREKILAALEKEPEVEEKDLIVSGSVRNILGPRLEEQFFSEFDRDFHHLEIALGHR
ncbi:hypothetical protein A3J19_01680 [Candidatus Daviesbacteria bacterium RIFCSPLOWO2_02_FULL_41_8]|uniref:Uncharacterized protein n=1 Tax=Candidatus Daviesbacteria bacterium RIFCSPLOWO2_02_FULL_41_8 TaxID=1797798 RepID=A0A1F5NIP8_9BACT|nr:MAG: hypothetical protein A3J19_01680 [Candidatus Daviesbacteria bacterium RIFCSPLOWO2_02_FULL_41_8]OGI16593.1 MAG: hypothetical protein A3J63_01965 [Candidatus Moranbacteria bacterium RIFCSPHIGHO2_02_FULL_40_12b]OGI23394.1 MAG: hypothetical protein A3E91_02470 [Candidatus Moranbacteria bacterium RIFCSPHIGHO2_12_FULL_40_10]